MNVISYSGGVQSTALLVIAAQAVTANAVAVFVDLREAEDPRTRDYVYRVARSFCEREGIKFVTVQVDALGDILVNPAHPKPPFRSEGGGFSKRQCTSHWKIRPFRRALRALMRERGLRIRKSNVNVWMGISFDEIERVAQPNVAYYRHVFPLVDRRLTREDCIQVIRDAGLPVPPKSACWFCPYTSAARTREIADKFPDVYGNLVMLQTVVGLARARRGLPRLIIGEGEGIRWLVADTA